MDSDSLGQRSTLQAQIDALDRHLDTVPHEDARFRPLLRQLSRLCGESELLPTSYELAGIVALDENEAYSVGGFSDVWRGTHNGQPVALKILRLHAGDRARVKKIFCREAVFWKRLSHENIVPFLGTSPRSHVCIVAEWMEHGDILSYLERFPLADRRQLITDVARGLNYMHASGVIHGDVKGRNILVDGEHHARLSDFGLSTTILGTETLASFTETSANRGSLRYMAPELLDHTVDSVALTTRADVYGFAMAMWEIFEGRIPFHEIRVDYVVVLKIKDGVRPPRPADTTGLGLDDEMWGLIQDCWTANPSQRPTMSRVLARLSSNTLLAPVPVVVPVLSGDQTSSRRRADRDLDPVEYTLPNRISFNARPAVTRDVLGILNIGGEDTIQMRAYTPIRRSGDGCFATVYLCDWHSPTDLPRSTLENNPRYAGRHVVAVKHFKQPFTAGYNGLLLLHEVQALLALGRHRNIVQLYDIMLLEPSNELIMVFEAMEGNLYQLIKARKGRFFAQGLLASITSQVLAGLHYVHQAGFVHRDIKPENILITTTGMKSYGGEDSDRPDVAAVAKLCDFGHAKKMHPDVPDSEYVSVRWYRAPEILLHCHKITAAVDMWSLGAVLAELATLQPLFPGTDEIDQLHRIVDIIGDPVERYGLDDHGRPHGGRQWLRGVEIARRLGFSFPLKHPDVLANHFDASMPSSLIACIADLLKWDPDARLTSRQMQDHPYLLKTLE